MRISLRTKMFLFTVSFMKEPPGPSESLSTFCLTELESLVLHGVRRKQQATRFVAFNHTQSHSVYTNVLTVRLLSLVRIACCVLVLTLLR